MFALAVLEHIQYPDQFVTELIRLAKPVMGTVYAVAPDFSSRARKLMGKKWPFFIPGEHLNIPSREGARIVFHAALRKLADRSENRSAFSNSISLPYPLRYTLDYLGLDVIGGIFPKSSRFPLWAGVLESGIAGKVAVA